MQSEYIKTELPLLLPPAQSEEQKNNEIHQAKKRGRPSIQHFACIICATLSLFIFSASAVEKIKEITEAGTLNYIEEKLFSSEAGLGAIISEVSFGNLSFENETKFPAVMPQTRPTNILYIPKKQISDKLTAEKAEENKSKEELYSYENKRPSGTYPIIPIDLCAASEKEIKNETSFSLATEQLASNAGLYEWAGEASSPLVLIVHTHGTESFAEEGISYYNDDINYPRSEDISKNIVAVGRVLCEELNRAGIPTLHCETMHDKDSYIKAYERSAESIKKYLEKYPSIKYVFDVHRDSLIRTDSTKLRPVAMINGKATAQIMMIVGTDEKADFTYNWEDNLLLAMAVQSKLFDDSFGVARQIYLRGATYNQQHAKHGLLLEIGSCGNTLGEAKEAAKAFADAFINTIQ